MIASYFLNCRHGVGKLLLFLFLLISASGVARAQNALRVVRANSTTIDIQDGNRFKKANWTVQPGIPLDVYNADRTSKKKRVTFRTDIDSITFDVEPGKEYDFVVLLRNKYRCTTRISALHTGYRRLASKDKPTFPDEIPFTLGHGDKIHIQGNINGSAPLDLLFDTGADTVVLYPSAFAKKAQVERDGNTQNSGYGGVTTRQTSSDNTLEIAGLQWDHESVLLVEKQADPADGIIGFNVFENKVVEIDYDRMVLRIRDALPKKRDGYKKVDTRMQEGLPTIQATLNTGATSITDWFVFDTGSDSTLHLSHAFAESNKLSGTMRKIGISHSGGVGNKVIENDRVVLPELVIAGIPLPNVPIDMATGDEGFVLRSSFGMQVLKRFNTLLDFPNNQIYLKPSKVTTP